MKRNILHVAMIVLLISFTYSCREKKSTGEKVEDAVEEAGDKIEEGAEEVEDAVEDATDGN